MVTIRDIAKEAGVSVSTASRALNDNPHVSQATRQRVQQLAEQMGYVPNLNAKNLTNGEANAVGVIFPTSDRVAQANPFYIDLLRGINLELVAHHAVLSIAIGSTPEMLLQNVRAMVQQSHIKKFIFLYSDVNDEVAQWLRDQDIPFVIVGHPIDHGDDLFVDNDNFEAGAAAARYLLTHYHVKHPVFVESNQGWEYEMNRREGFERVMAAYHIPVRIISITAETSNTETIHAIENNPAIDGVIATDDDRAMEFYRLWHLTQTETIPFISFNQTVAKQLVDNEFHSINLFPERMGEAAAQLLFQSDESTRARHRLIPFEIN
ncbi:LacI family DNA-binding transcriptional regulator [Levilactobacillus bambusae]|uniref:LacI family transcriptional regulator n=1 Tax=Levilactobacillus bambusae TaxID=2024736 RepID=A0A2V1MZD2_9LACO|nr:LacI family DNA-binding transcriptional regulator [Levilactobacillus bambusae]PWG00327.1 LacI family transcriptional regulator [Levilactobacillus bambusae]